MKRKSHKVFIGLSIFILAGFFVLLGWSSYRYYFKERELSKRQELYPSIRVEVLNGTDIPQLARNVSFYIRDIGFDVVYFGNSPERFDKTVVVERIDPRLRNAELLADAIGCKNILKELDRDRLLEVTLIVGKDYKQIFRGLRKALF